jgi:hypothetical protein
MIHHGGGNNTIPLLNVLITRRGSTLATKMYKKPTHTGCSLHFTTKEFIVWSTKPRLYVKEGMILGTKLRTSDETLYLYSSFYCYQEISGKKRLL